MYEKRLQKRDKNIFWSFGKGNYIHFSEEGPNIKRFMIMLKVTGLN